MANGIQIGEWNGETGTIHDDEHKRIGRMNTQHPTMTSFMNAIAENPEEATTRMVFADWLDENNKPNEAAILRSDKPIFSWPSTPAPITWSQISQWDGLISGRHLRSIVVLHNGKNVTISKFKIVQDLLQMILNR